MKKTLFKASFLLFAGVALHMPVQAQSVPEITPSLTRMLGALPLDDAREKLQKLGGALKKTSCGGSQTGCYATQSGPLQLYFSRVDKPSKHHRRHAGANKNRRMDAAGQFRICFDFGQAGRITVAWPD